MAEYISFQPSDYYKTHLYTGTGASNAITGVGFKPDTVWLKERDGSDNHQLINSVIGAGYYSSPDENVILQTLAESLKSFDSDGFTVGTAGQINQNTKLYLSWNWLGGTTSGIDATGADITPNSYSFNQTSGMSIIEFEGTGTQPVTFPHGLGAVPAMIIIKSLDTTADWTVYHHNMTSTGNANTRAVELNTSGAQASVNYWKDTSPTSVLVTLGNDAQVNPTSTMIAYCFAPKKGYSSFGGYKGNGNADGTFVYTGFRPAFIMCKDIGASNSWITFDDKRLGYNVDNNAMTVNSPNAELTTDLVDILSNGFKFRSTSNPNTSSNYIYAAFAEFPIVSSNDVPGVAR